MSSSIPTSVNARRSAPAHYPESVPVTDSRIMGYRVLAGVFDVVTVLALVILMSRIFDFGAVSGILAFILIRAVYEILSVNLVSATAGKALLGLSISGHEQFDERPSLRASVIRHFMKSGDLFLLATVLCTALAVGVGTPDSLADYFYLVALIPLTVITQIGFLATPVTLWTSALSDPEHQGLHDRAAKTYVFKK